MANELGMFGVMPEDIQRQIQEGDNNEAFRMAQLSPGRVGVAVAGQQSRMAGRAIESALGIEDPRVKRAKEMQAIVQEIQGQEGMDDPATFYQTIAKKLAERGFMNEATAMYSKVADLKNKNLDRDLKLAQIEETSERRKEANEIARERVAAAKAAAEAQAARNALVAAGKDPDWLKNADKQSLAIAEIYGPEGAAKFWESLRDTKGDFAAAHRSLKGMPKINKNGPASYEANGRVFIKNEDGSYKDVGAAPARGTNVRIDNNIPRDNRDIATIVDRTAERGKKPLEAIRSMDAAIKLLESDNPNAQMQGRTALVGVFQNQISNQDWLRGDNVGSLVDKLGNNLSEFTTGTITEKSRKEKVEVLKQIRKVAADEVKRINREGKAQVDAVQKGVPIDLEKLMTVPDSVNEDKPKKRIKVTLSSGKTVEVEQ